jgi:hypothetical protein
LSITTFFPNGLNEIGDLVSHSEEVGIECVTFFTFFAEDSMERMIPAA